MNAYSLSLEMQDLDLVTIPSEIGWEANVQAIGSKVWSMLEIRNWREISSLF